MDYGNPMMSLWRSRLPTRGRTEDHDDIPGSQARETAPANRLLELQRTVGNQAVLRMLGDRGSASQAMNDTLHSPGEPLDEFVRAPLEASFGRDFSRVRIHTDARAAASAKALNARAYTVGNQIAYANGEYDPHSFEGPKLPRTQLTPVAQPSRSQRAGVVEDLPVIEPSEPAEAEAHSVSDRV